MAELGTRTPPDPDADPEQDDAADLDLNNTAYRYTADTHFTDDYTDTVRNTDDARPRDADPMADFVSTSAPRPDEGSRMRCCCGRNDCAYLKHSCSVLETVEKDVHTAAKLGKVRPRSSFSSFSLLSLTRRNIPAVPLPKPVPISRDIPTPHFP